MLCFISFLNRLFTVFALVLPQIHIISPIHAAPPLTYGTTEKSPINKWIYKFYNPINSVKDINWLDCLLSLHHWSVGLFYWFVYWWISSFNLSFELLPSCFRHPPMYFTAMYAIQLFDMLRANITAQVSYTDCIRSAQSSDHRCNEQKIAFNELLTLISSPFIYFISFGSIAYVLCFYSFCAFNFDLIYCTEDKMNDILCSRCSHRWLIHFFQFNYFLYWFNLNHSQQFKM